MTLTAVALVDCAGFFFVASSLQACLRIGLRVYHRAAVRVCVCIGLSGLQMWVQGGRKEDIHLEMFQKSVRGMRSLFQRSSPSDLLYIAELDGSLKAEMEHLVCFVPGWLGLAAFNA